MRMPPFRVLRWIHALASPFIGALVYSPSLRQSADYVLLVQAVVFPLVAGVGLWMLLGPRLTKRLRGSAPLHPPGAGA